VVLCGSCCYELLGAEVVRRSFVRGTQEGGQGREGEGGCLRRLQDCRQSGEERYVCACGSVFAWVRQPVCVRLADTVWVSRGLGVKGASTLGCRVYEGISHTLALSWQRQYPGFDLHLKV
jgi:hypothetical protein